MRIGVGVLLIAGWAIGSFPSGQVVAAGHTTTQTSARPAPTHRQILDTYCVACHNARLKTAGVALDEIDVAQVTQSAELWEKVVRKLRAGAMPPPGRPRPDQATYDAFAS